MSTKLKAALLGASGYTGADLLRLGVLHPQLEFTALTANTHAGKPLGAVFPHLDGLGLPQLQQTDDMNWDEFDVVFCGLPHATSQAIIAEIVENHDRPRIIDMSADYRLRDPDSYQKWYGNKHIAPHLQQKAAYGLSEHYRDEIKEARIIACPGCYPTAALLALIPLAKAKVVDAADIVIDAKSGVSGAGRGLKQNTLFAEAGESLSPYAVASHRHSAELDQEISLAAGQDVVVGFTPHLIPMSRGELVTCHLKLAEGHTATDVRERLKASYDNEPFVQILEDGVFPSTNMVRGSNLCKINVFEDRIPGRVIVIATLDNLVKGSAGQAIQNFNIAFGLEETTGLQQVALFP
ncbi:N-acetyl-gamma-glutamyl-phosphate reductase [Maritalea myrionectae]|uniref:N-acetyl-gamma-glutamyl-phosphate reductase n=1 Tax=Maritalea myrionectae TaxID=454601 RepID=A0A2R4MFE9_9HYPH|nr:N-acetyl-gamma-glutamyl-phosphate reductase [Maritalea myrionectae]AVX04771.1 N-acetyl-gamma-glutamyl-phosphate reductase [Maritalea myrionectae]